MLKKHKNKAGAPDTGDGMAENGGVGAAAADKDAADGTDADIRACEKAACATGACESADTAAANNTVANDTAADASDAAPPDNDLSAKLAEAERQAREYLERWQRSAAEFDNYRRRTQNEMEKLYASSAADIIGAFLPIVDSIERAVAAADTAANAAADNQTDAASADTTSADATSTGAAIPDAAGAADTAKSADAADTANPAGLREGLVLIDRQVRDVLRKLKVEPLPGVGEQFDPNVHEAVMHAVDENSGPNTITEVFVKGYAYRDRVVRHSMVKVAN